MLTRPQVCISSWLSWLSYFFAITCFLRSVSSALCSLYFISVVESLFSSLVLGSCVRPESGSPCAQRARQSGRARRHRGYGRALASRGGVRRSAVAFFVARRGVSIETRGKHEGALSALLRWYQSITSGIIRVVFLSKRTYKRCLFIGTHIIYRATARRFEHHHDGAGERGPR